MYPDRIEAWNRVESFDRALTKWHIRYDGRDLAQHYPVVTASVEAIAETMRVAAHNAELVSRKMGTEPFTRLFVAMQEALESPSPEPAWFGGLLPNAPHNPLAHRLLHAVARGWVFGGMGSWLDQGTDFGAATMEEYDLVTSRLWDAVVSAVAVAANAYSERPGGFGPPTGHRP